MKVRVVRCGNLLKGGKWDALTARLKKQGALLELGYVTHEEVAEVLSVCDVLSFPSKYEGFGMPIMEAQVLEVPVVAARCSCLPEVAGDGALFHDPDDAEELADQLLKTVRDSGLREILLAKGRENVKRFGPGNHIRVLKEVYSRLG